MVLSRPVQRAGLVLGFALYGLTAGLLFAAAYAAVAPRVPDVAPARLGLGLALASGWAVAVFPFLKYPANPPAVGDPATIYYRQRLYLEVLGLSVVGAVAAFAAVRLLARARGLGRGPRRLLVLALYAGYATAVYLLLPDNPDPVPLPMDLVWAFRACSLAGLALFWGLLGVLAALLLGRKAAGALDRRASPAD